MIIAITCHPVYRDRNWQLDFVFQVSWAWNTKRMERNMKKLCGCRYDYRYGDPIDVEITADYLETKYDRDLAFMAEYARSH